MKWTTPIILLTVITGLRAEVHQLTLKQAVDTALKQNPEIILARLDEQKAALGVTVAKDPFIPRVVVGSGLAQSWGFPLSIEGSAPSIIRAQAIMSVYNRSYSYLVAQAKENARTATIDQNAKRDDIAFRTASAYLDILRARQALDMLRRQAESLQRVQETVAMRVTEGRELPVEGKRAEFNLSRSRQRADALELDSAHAETSLALVLGYGPNDRVRPVGVEGEIADLPESEESSVETALENSKEVRIFESQLQAKGFEKRSYDAQRLHYLFVFA
jgi:outer membrane protein TolC